MNYCMLIWVAVFAAGAVPIAQPLGGAYVYHISDSRGEYDVVSLLPPERMGRDGIPGVAILGQLKRPLAAGGDIEPDNVIVNADAVRFLHAFIARTAPTLPGAIAAALDGQRRGDRWLNYVDGRTTARADAAREDLIGTFTIVDGRISPETYRANAEHRMVTKDGLVRLDPEMHALYLDVLAKEIGDPARPATKKKAPK